MRAFNGVNLSPKARADIQRRFAPIVF
jgi:hypothetical protein